MHPQWNGMSTEEKLEQLKKVLGALEQAVGDRTMRLALDLDDALTSHQGVGSSKRETGLRVTGSL